jgi:DNA-binding response OmpR family regulator
MHILILAPTLASCEELRSALDNSNHRCTPVTTWADALPAIRKDSPDLVLISRAALDHLEPGVLLSMAEPEQWPPMMFVDVPTPAVREGTALARRLNHTPPPYQIGDLHIDTRRKRAGLGERWATLPPLQYRLLLTLAQRVGEVVTYRELLQSVWGYDEDDKDARELLKEHIRRLRRRLRLDPEHPYIRSVRGFGYMLAPPDED